LAAKRKVKNSDEMSLREDIFDEFIRKLEAAKLSAKFISALRKLWVNDELNSKEVIRVLKEVGENAADQDN
jgi:hypothetical protein